MFKAAKLSLDAFTSPLQPPRNAAGRRLDVEASVAAVAVPASILMTGTALTGRALSGDRWKATGVVTA